MTVDVDTLVELVLQRLLRPRVGLLWWNETLPSARMPEEEITWIHYLGTKCLPRESVRPCITLAMLDAPEEEAKTLTLLAIPRCRPSLLQELITGIPASPEARLVAGCLAQGISVVADTNHLASWHSWKGALGARLRNAFDELESLGMTLIGRETQAASPDDFRGAPANALSQTAATAVTVETRASVGPDDLLRQRKDGPFWITWKELAGHVEGKTFLTLPPGARLTAEAADRLSALRIAVYREEA
jgi:hypothetical protein